MRSHPMRQNTLSSAAIVALMASAGLSFSAGAAELARVISSTPVTASVPVASQVCSDGEQVVQTAPSGAGAVIGAIAGGVLGHNLGGGFGRAAATGIGVVAGSVVGNSVEAANTPATAVPVRRCQNVSQMQTRTVGYDVVYEYAGQRYSTRMSRDPGQQFAVSVQPADGSLPAPVEATPAAQPLTPIYTAPAPVYYQPAYSYYPYYAPSPFIVAPVIGFGFGYRGHWR